MKQIIRHRYDSTKVLYEGEHETLRAAIAAKIDLAGAYLAGADLAGAYLAGAYLAGAYLAGADLAGANLADANLAGAYLAGADLAGADLAGAYLAGADLAGAYLAGAYLAGADLAGAYLAGADLAGADLAGADLAGAYLAGAYLAGAKNVPSIPVAADGTVREPRAPQTREQWLAQRPKNRQESMARYRALHPDVPVVENLDGLVLEAINAPGQALEMTSWHGGEDEDAACGTTHCRGGWAVILAGEAGRKLEESIGVEKAARAIYLASTGRSPHFYATNERARQDIERCAAEAAAPAPAP